MRPHFYTSLPERSQIKTLLQKCFYQTYLDDFPLWETPYISACGFKDKNNQLISFAGLKCAKLQIPPFLFSIGIIGAVGTHPDYQNQGFATQSLYYLLEIAKKKKLDFLVLWSDKVRFYEKFGFFRFGQQAFMSLDLNRLPQPQTTVDIGWKDWIFQEMQHRTLGIKKKDYDLEWICKHSYVQWFSVERGSHRAAVAFGRGMDLKNCVHEWIGPLHLVFEIFYFLKKNYQDATLLSHPQFFDFYIYHFNTLCLFYPLHQQLDLHFLNQNLWLWGLDAN